MSRFRKRPIVIEAVQYDGENGRTLMEWSRGKAIESPVLEPRPGNPTGSYMQIETPEGWMTAVVGDWIIRGVRGEYYPCKPDIFMATYEPYDVVAETIEDLCSKPLENRVEVPVA